MSSAEDCRSESRRKGTFLLSLALKKGTARARDPPTRPRADPAACVRAVRLRNLFPGSKGLFRFNVVAQDPQVLWSLLVSGEGSPSTKLLCRQTQFFLSLPSLSTPVVLWHSESTRGVTAGPCQVVPALVLFHLSSNLLCQVYLSAKLRQTAGVVKPMIFLYKAVYRSRSYHT